MRMYKPGSRATRGEHQRLIALRLGLRLPARRAQGGAASKRHGLGVRGRSRGAGRERQSEGRDQGLPRSPSPVSSFSREESFSPGRTGQVPKPRSLHPHWLLRILPSISILHVPRFGAALEQVRACCSCREESSQLLAIAASHRGLFLHTSIGKQLPTPSAPSILITHPCHAARRLTPSRVTPPALPGLFTYGCSAGCSQLCVRMHTMLPANALITALNKRPI